MVYKAVSYWKYFIIMTAIKNSDLKLGSWKLNLKQVYGRIYHIFTSCFCLNKSVGILMATVMYLLTLGACFCFVGLITNIYIRQKRKMSFRKGTFFLQLLFCCCLVAESRPTRLLCPWDFPGRNIGVGCHFLLQGTFPTQGSNPGVWHWQADSFLLSH